MKDEIQETVFYTISEFAYFFKISKSLAYKIAKANGFPKTKIGNKIFISKDKLKIWMDKNCNGDLFRDKKRF